MILAAHQPQYLPWLGYFHKMASCDLFIYLDDVQYKKREFQNRNRIRVKEGWQWLTVPVVSKGRYTQELRHVEIEPGSRWGEEHWKALEYAYPRAPHFAEWGPRFRELYAGPWARLGDMCSAFTLLHREMLGIATPLRRSSEFNLDTVKTQRLVDLCRAAGADTYLSGQGAREYLEEPLFEQAGIRLAYQEFKHPTYPQAYAGFEPCMAALDLVFNCGAESGKILLEGK